MHEIVHTNFVMVYYHTDFSWFSRKYFQWLYEIYAIMTREYKKNLKALYVIHPSWKMKSFFFFM